MACPGAHASCEGGLLSPHPGLARVGAGRDDEDLLPQPPGNFGFRGRDRQAHCYEQCKVNSRSAYYLARLEGLESSSVQSRLVEAL